MKTTRWAPFGWLAFAVLCASLLALAVPVMRPADAGLGAWNPFWSAVEVELPAATEPEAAGLVEAVRRALPGGHAELLREGGAYAVLAIADRGSADLVRAVTGLAHERGLATGGFEMGSNLSRVAERAWRDPRGAGEAAGRLLPIALFCGSGVLLLLGALLVRRLPERTSGAPPGTGPGVARRVAVGVVGGACLLLAVEATGAVMALLGAPIVEQPWLAQELSGDGARRLAVIGAVVVLAPLGEEVFFRGYMLRALAAAWGERGALLLSSLAFALVHGHAPALPAYLLYGLGLALLARRTGSLVPPVVAHAVVNGTAVAFAMA